MLTSQWKSFYVQSDVVTGARFTYTCYGISNLAFHCSGPTWAYLGPTLPTSKSLAYIALSLPSLPWAHLANQQIIGIHCFEPTEPTSSLPCQPTNHWNTLLWNLCYAFFAMQSLQAYLESTLRLPLPTSNSLEFMLWGCLGYLQLCNLATHSLLCDLCYAIFAMQSLLCSFCYAFFAMRSLL